MEDNLLFIISGPSGSGKGTLLKFVEDKYADRNLYLSVSMTTREKREGEIEGVHYYFVSKDHFKKQLADDYLLEYNILPTGDMYGTPRGPLEEAMKNKRPCILEIEPNGMKKAKKYYPSAITIFIAPPSLEELERRLRNRGTETEATIEKRLLAARNELKTMNDYDYIVINDDLEIAARELIMIFAYYLD